MMIIIPLTLGALVFFGGIGLCAFFLRAMLAGVQLALLLTILLWRLLGPVVCCTLVALLFGAALVYQVTAGPNSAAGQARAAAGAAATAVVADTPHPVSFAAITAALAQDPLSCPYCGQTIVIRGTVYSAENTPLPEDDGSRTYDGVATIEGPGSAIHEAECTDASSAHPLRKGAQATFRGQVTNIKYGNTNADWSLLLDNCDATSA